MSAKSQGICWGLTAVLTVFSDVTCFRGISLLETQGIVHESGSSSGHIRKTEGISPPQSCLKTKQVCTNVQGELSVTKKCQWCSCLQCFKIEKLMQKECQSQKRVVEICRVFKRNKSKQITSLKSDLV